MAMSWLPANQKTRSLEGRAETRFSQSKKQADRKVNGISEGISLKINYFDCFYWKWPFKINWLTRALARKWSFHQFISEQMDTKWLLWGIWIFFYALNFHSTQSIEFSFEVSSSLFLFYFILAYFLAFLFLSPAPIRLGFFPLPPSSTQLLSNQVHPF